MRPPSACGWWIAAALGSAAAVGCAPLAGQSTPGRSEVVEVRFEGNESFPADSLARAIVTRETECRTAVFAPFCWLGADFAIQRAYLPRRELPRDLLRLRIWYRQRGFRQTLVDTATAVRPDGSTEVTFTVTEGPPTLIDTIEFVGAEAVAGELEGFLDDLPIAAGDRLSILRMDAVRDTLVRRLANRGYARADVLRSWLIPTGENAARVTFDIAPGVRTRYGDIEIEGNAHLSDFTVLRTLQFRTGDLYRRERLEAAQARLFGLEIVRSALIAQDLVSGPDSVIPIRVTVQEGEPRRVRAGAGWSSSECLDVEARWVSRNFFGGGRRLQVRGRLANVLAEGFQDILCPQSGDGVFARVNWLASVELSQPWIFSTRNSFQGSLYVERQSLPDAFVREAVGASVALTRAIGPRNPLTVSWRPELSRLQAAEFLFCASFLVCTSDDVGALQNANWLSPVGINFTRDATNNVLNPSRGYTAIFDLEHAAPWTGSDFRYDRAIAEGTWYERAGTSAILAGRVRAGWVGAGAFEELVGARPRGNLDIVHPQKRFYAGGANSVRGFAQNRLGPRVLATRDVSDLLLGRGDGGAGCAPEQVIDLSCDAAPLEDGFFVPRPTGGTRVVEGSLELRLPMGREFQLAGFTDFGRLWRPEQGGRGSLEITPGVGVRYFSPIGPLRVDVAYRFRGGEDLPVVTRGIRPFVVGQDRPEDRIGLAGDPIDWVRTTELVALRPLVFFGDSSAGDIQRFQLHISIGQAF